MLETCRATSAKNTPESYKNSSLKNFKIKTLEMPYFSVFYEQNPA